jgi:hypothetical protein
VKPELRLHEEVRAEIPSYFAEKSAPPTLRSMRFEDSGPTAVIEARPAKVPGSPKTEAAIVFDSPRRNVSLPE